MNKDEVAIRLRDFSPFGMGDEVSLFRLKEALLRGHFGAMNYGGWSTGNVTDEMVQGYLEHHHNPSNQDSGNMILDIVGFGTFSPVATYALSVHSG